MAVALRPSLFSRLAQPTLLRIPSRLPLPQSISLPRQALQTRTFTLPSLRRTRPRIHQSTNIRNSNRTTRANSSTTSPPKPNNSLSQRLRTLSREYGWAALGVYLGLSALDFPFCFVAVRLLGVERIGHWEGVVVGAVKDAVDSVWPGLIQRKTNTEGQGEGEGDSQGEGEVAVKGTEEASIWTQLALAYAVHKSLIFIRVPLTAAVTPKIVKVLRRWGWDIGKRKPKSG